MSNKTHYFVLFSHQKQHLSTIVWSLASAEETVHRQPTPIILGSHLWLNKVTGSTPVTLQSSTPDLANTRDPRTTKFNL